MFLPSSLDNRLGRVHVTGLRAFPCLQKKALFLTRSDLGPASFLPPLSLWRVFLFRFFLDNADVSASMLRLKSRCYDDARDYWRIPSPLVYARCASLLLPSLDVYAHHEPAQERRSISSCSPA